MILLTRAIDFLTKPPTPGMRSLFWSYWSQLSRRLPNHYTLLLLPMVASQSIRWVPNVEEFMYLRHKTQRIPNEYDLKACTVGTSFHGTRRKHAEEEANQQSYQVMIPMNHINDLHCTIAPRVQECHTYLQGNQQLLIELKTFNKKEIMPGTGKPVLVVLVKSEVLEENLQVVNK